MINHSTACNLTGPFAGNTTAVTIVNEQNYRPASIGLYSNGINSTTVRVGPSSFGPSYKVSPEQRRRDHVSLLCTIGIWLISCGSVPTIIGVAMLGSLVFLGAFPLIFGGVAVITGVSLFIASRYIKRAAKNEPAQAADLNFSIISCQMEIPSSSDRIWFTNLFGQTPPQYTDSDRQPPPQYTDPDVQLPPPYIPPDSEFVQRSQPTEEAGLW